VTNPFLLDPTTEIFIAKAKNAGQLSGLSGIIGQWSFSCYAIPEDLITTYTIHMKPWYMLAQVSSPTIIGSWFPDFQAMNIGNELKGSHKQPVLYTDVGTSPTIWDTDVYKIVTDSQMRIDVSSYARWDNTEVVFTLTLVAKVKILVHPAAVSNFIVIEGNRSIALAINAVGELILTYLDAGTMMWTSAYSSSISLAVGETAFIRFTYSVSDVTP